MLRKISLLVVMTIALASQVSAQLLWKVSDPKSGKTSYLFGTHHVAPVSLLDSVTGYAEAFNGAEIVMGEMDMASASTPAAQQTLALAGMAPADSTLSKLLTPAQLDSVATVLSRYIGAEVPIMALNGMKPAMLSTMLAMAQAQTAFPDFNPALQLDGYIQQQAHGAGKQVKGLETIEQQASILFGNSLVEQAADLMKAVGHDSEALDFARRLATLYVNGDLDGIQTLMSDPTLGFTAAEADRMLYARNAEWVKVLAGILPTASVLIVVGAGHLGGPRGLISLLRGQGYNVTAM